MVKSKGFAMSSTVALLSMAAVVFIVLKASSLQVSTKNEQKFDLAQQFSAIHKALDAHYTSTCETGTISQDDLIGLYYPKKIIFPHGEDFVLKIFDTGPVPYSKISIKLNDDGYTNNYAQTIVKNGGELSTDLELSLKKTLLGRTFLEAPCGG